MIIGQNLIQKQDYTISKSKIQSIEYKKKHNSQGTKNKKKKIKFVMKTRKARVFEPFFCRRIQCRRRLRWKRKGGREEDEE